MDGLAYIYLHTQTDRKKQKGEKEKKMDRREAFLYVPVDYILKTTGIYICNKKEKKINKHTYTHKHTKKKKRCLSISRSEIVPFWKWRFRRDGKDAWGNDKATKNKNTFDQAKKGGRVW
jgi:hypothetical protein